VGNIEIIKLLVKSLGPGLMHLRNSNNDTALHGASDNNHAEVVELFLELCADVKAVGRSGYTPLSCAAEFICPDSAKALLAAGAAVNHVDDDGRTPLDGAHFIRDFHPDLVTSRLHLFDELIKVLKDAGGLRAAELPDDDNDNNNDDA
jgi:ankyrin repeat protein